MMALCTRMMKPKALSIKKNRIHLLLRLLVALIFSNMFHMSFADNAGNYFKCINRHVVQVVLQQGQVYGKTTTPTGFQLEPLVSLDLGKVSASLPNSVTGKITHIKFLHIPKAVTEEGTPLQAEKLEGKTFNFSDGTFVSRHSLPAYYTNFPPSDWGKLTLNLSPSNAFIMDISISGTIGQWYSCSDILSYMPHQISGLNFHLTFDTVTNDDFLSPPGPVHYGSWNSDLHINPIPDITCTIHTSHYKLKTQDNKTTYQGISGDFVQGSNMKLELNCSKGYGGSLASVVPKIYAWVQTGGSSSPTPMAYSGSTAPTGNGAPWCFMGETNKSPVMQVNFQNLTQGDSTPLMCSDYGTESGGSINNHPVIGHYLDLSTVWAGDIQACSTGSGSCHLGGYIQANVYFPGGGQTYTTPNTWTRHIKILLNYT